MKMPVNNKFVNYRNGGTADKTAIVLNAQGTDVEFRKLIMIIVSRVN
jgi:hypothetical protein